MPTNGLLLWQAKGPGTGLPNFVLGTFVPTQGRHERGG